MFHLTVVLGTRPEIIKLSPILRAAKRQGVPLNLIHTNQHYSAELDAIFFQELQLDPPQYNLHVGAGTQTAQTARMMTGIEEVLLANPTSCLIVQGDTNSVLAGAMVASKLRVPLAHLEAGLRSGDRDMPEEINRIITDHIADLLLPPTQECADSLLAEGIDPTTIEVVGNTVVDSVLQNKEVAAKVDLADFGLRPKGYYLLTLHRPANVDGKEDLEEIFSFLEKVHAKTGITFYFPAHPRPRGSIEKHGLTVPACVQLAQPVGYVQFLALQMNAAAIFTDSGGIQEEACILQVPCITLRDTTERPETVEVGANILAYRDAEKALAGLETLNQKKRWENPFGDGSTGERTVSLLRQRFGVEPS